MAFDPAALTTVHHLSLDRRIPRKDREPGPSAAPREVGLPTPEPPAPPLLVREFRADDGRFLRYSVLSAASPSPLLLHLNGLEGHGGWFLPTALALRDRGVSTVLLDRRGSGLNRTAAPGDARSAELLLRDVRRCRESLGDPELHLVGQSWGGKLALAAALDRPELVRSLVLVTPELRTLDRLPLAVRIRAGLGLLVGGRIPVRLPSDAAQLTRRADRRRFVDADPWRIRSVTPRFLLASRRLDGLIDRQVGDLRIPVLLFLAGQDPIVDNRGVMDVLRPLSRLRVRVFSQAVHSLPLDEASLLARETADFLGAEADDPA